MSVLAQLKKEDFVKILEKYSIGRYITHEHLEWILENQVYILRTNKGRYILKLLNNINLKSMKQQLELIDFLYKKGIPVVKNIKYNCGGEIFRYSRKYLVIQDFVKGYHPKRYSNTLIKDVAMNLAKMHKVLLNSRFKKGNRKKCIFKKRDLSKDINPSIVGIQSELIKNLNKINQQKLRKAIIHGDISEVNLLVKNNKLNAIIDWDDSDYSSLVYEIAIFIAHSFIRSERIYEDKIKFFLREYQKYIKLNKEERNALYFLIKYRLFGILYWYLKYSKIHPNKTHELEKGILRSVARLENFDRYPIEDFMKLF